MKNIKIKKNSIRPLKKGHSCQRFLGLSLGGAKTNKSALAIVDYFIDEKKVFLMGLHEKIQSDKKKSSDVQLFELTERYKDTSQSIAVNTPLSLPKCIRCRLKCPGYEKCTEPEIIWLWKKYRENSKKTKKLFTPYTERCAEIHLAQDLEEQFIKDHALGANQAPIVARAQFLKKRMSLPLFETYPLLSLWRIGRSLGIPKSLLKKYRHSVEGVYVRSKILEILSKKNVSFMYNQDIQSMALNLESFDAYLCALTGVFKYIKQVDKKPLGFPKNEGWVVYPKTEINWDFVNQVS